MAGVSALLLEQQICIREREFNIEKYKLFPQRNKVIKAPNNKMCGTSFFAAFFFIELSTVTETPS
jgi:hypothetical protein